LPRRRTGSETEKGTQKNKAKKTKKGGCDDPSNFAWRYGKVKCTTHSPGKRCMGRGRGKAD